MGSSNSTRLKRPTVRLSNAITGATFQHPEGRLHTADQFRDERPSQIYLQTKLEPQCQDCSQLEEMQSIPEDDESKEQEEGGNFFFSPVPDLDREYNQLINEILVSQRKSKLADSGSQPEQEQSRLERKGIQRVQSSQIECLFRRIKTIKSIIQRNTSPDPNEELSLSQYYGSVRRGVTRQVEQASLDELDRLVFSNSNIVPITDLSH